MHNNCHFRFLHPQRVITIAPIFLSKTDISLEKIKMSSIMEKWETSQKVTTICEYHIYHMHWCDFCAGRRLARYTKLDCNLGTTLVFNFNKWVDRSELTRSKRAEGLILTKRFNIRDQYPIQRDWSNGAIYTTESEVRLQVFLKKGTLRLYATLLADNRHASDRRLLTIHSVNKDKSSDSKGEVTDELRLIMQVPLKDSRGLIKIRFCRGDEDKVNSRIDPQQNVCVGCATQHDQWWGHYDKQCSTHSGVLSKRVYIRTPNTMPTTLYAFNKIRNFYS